MQFKSLSRTISEQTKEFKMILLWEKFFVCSDIETLSFVYGIRLQNSKDLNFRRYSANICCFHCLIIHNWATSAVVFYKI